MEDYKEYRVENDLIKYDKNKKTLTFNKIKDVQDPKNVIYFVKLIKKDNYLPNENINTIAITQSSGQSNGYENLTSEMSKILNEKVKIGIIIYKNNEKCINKRKYII